MTNEEFLELLKKTLTTFIDIMDLGDEVEWEMNVTTDDNNVLSAEIKFTGESGGMLIGPKGRFIQSMEQILSLMLRKRLEPETSYHINLDVNNYRQEKNEKIIKMALQSADDARILGEPVDLNPMPAYMRRIIHIELKKFDDITTESFGEGKDRFVRIIPKSDEDYIPDTDTSNDDIEE